jgi:hypothetical protein
MATNNSINNTLASGSKISSTIEGAVVTSSIGVLSSVTGTAGYVLTANAAGSAPSFQVLPGTSSFTYTDVSSSPYVVLTTDNYISVDCSGGIITIQLPNTATLGRSFIIKDRTGSAAAFNITVTTVGGAVNIDGATTFVMNTAYESINVIGNGSTYEIY